MEPNTVKGEARSQTDAPYEYEGTWSIERRVAWSAVVRCKGVWRAQPAGLISVPAAGAGGIDAAVRAAIEAAILDLDDVTQPADRQPPE